MNKLLYNNVEGNPVIDVRSFWRVAQSPGSSSSAGREHLVVVEQLKKGNSEVWEEGRWAEMLVWN